MTPNAQVTLVLMAAAASLVGPVLCGAITNDQQSVIQQMNAKFEESIYKLVSDVDKRTMQMVQQRIDDDFVNFKNINEVHAFLDSVKLLVQKHPKNVAFAQGDLKDLHKFLSTEMVTRLIRVDTEPFNMPISDERLPFAQRAIDDDELTRKLFSGPLRSFIEAKKQHLSRSEDGNHRDGNFFSNLWCKISNSCAN